MWFEKLMSFALLLAFVFVFSVLLLENVAERQYRRLVKYRSISNLEMTLYKKKYVKEFTDYYINRFTTKYYDLLNLSSNYLKILKNKLKK